VDPTENDAVPTDDVAAPVADQPDVPTPDAPETPAAKEPTTDASPAPDEPEGDEESFTDVDTEGLPEDVQTRYAQMQADYTRKTQALAERHAELDQAVSFVSDLVSDEANDTQEAVFRVLAKRLGYAVEGEDEEGEPDTEPLEDEDVPEFRDPRLDPILEEREAEKARQAAEAYEAELDQHEATINDGIKAAAKVDGLELTEDEHDFIFDKVLALPPVVGADGQKGPDIAGAYAAYRKVTQADRNRWVKSKTTGGVPGNNAADEPVDLHDEEQRHQFMASRIEAARRAAGE
jgi:hypothetical protein